VTDRLTLTRALESGGMESPAAERVATEIYDAIHDNVATKTDLAQLAARIDLIEHRLLTRLGGMIIVATGILIAIFRVVMCRATS
jgi:hypothetical protein